MKNKSTLIIAEAGVNHNGSMQKAKQLIDVAAYAKVDLIKFQTFFANNLVTTSAKKANYQNRTTDSSESQYQMIKKLELSSEMHEELFEYCNRNKVGFFSTAFDLKSIDLLAKLGLKQFKIPSGEINNIPYLRHIGSYGKPLILSTGMATLGEIESALDILEKSGTPRNSITVLHCHTEYPTQMVDVNLRAMLSIRSSLGVEIGYSDHTKGIEVSIAAVALGASIIEKHFTLDNNLPGPDHMASLNPEELKKMVDSIRNIEIALGDGIKRPSLSELENMKAIRKSIVAAIPIKAGDILDESNLTVKRPGYGISPIRYDEVIGKVALKDFNADEFIII